MKIHRTYSLSWLLLLCLVLSPDLTAETREAQSDLHTIKVGIDLWPGYYPIVLAKELGYFKKRGLNVEYHLPENTDGMLNEFVEGKLDAVCVALGDAFSLYQRDSQLRVVLVSDESLGGDALLALGDLPKDLSDYKIGTNLNGFGELFINAFLEEKGLSTKGITLVQQEASQAMGFLKEGKADIVHSWEPYVTEAVSYLNANVVFDSSQTPGLIPDTVLLNGNFRLQHPQEAKAFIAAWLEAADWWLANRRRGDTIIETTLLLLPGTVNLEGIRLYTLKDNQNTFADKRSEQSLYSTTQKYIDFFYNKGVLKKRIKPEQIIDSAYLPK